MIRAHKAYKHGGAQALARPLFISLILGTFFVVVQGFEWVQLLNAGLTMTSSTLGGFFYLIVGLHALHAVLAIGLLLRLYIKLKKGTMNQISFWTVEAFWLFVVFVWPLICFAVYL